MAALGPGGFPPPPEGYEESARQVIGDWPALADDDIDPRDLRLPPGSYTPFAQGIANSLAARGGKGAKPTAMRVGAGEVHMEPPPKPVPRNQRTFIEVGATAKRVLPPVRRAQEAASLDGFMLLDACHVEDPADAVQAVLEGCNITRAVVEDLAFFTRLTHLDVGDNRLQLERLSGLPSLQELHIDCNGITAIDLPSGGFPRLEVLNLSYNGLSAEDVASLAQLACLRELDLTGNRLSRLPPDWTEFLELRKLTLDRNSIRSDAALNALATTPYLKELSLALNQIERLPAEAVENGGFGEVEVLNLAQNLIAHEDALVPLLQMRRLRSLSVWGNPFMRRGVPAAFDEVLSDRAVELTTAQPQQGPRASSYEHAVVLGLDAVVHSHRTAELAMRGSARAPPAPPHKRENPHIVQARAQIAHEAAQAASAIVSEVGSGGFFVTQAGAVRPGGNGGAQQAGEGAQPAAPRATLQELRDALLLSDEAEALIDSNIDVRTALNALKYALEHPLAEVDVDAPTHHQQTTTAFEASRRDKFVRARDPLNVGLRAAADGDGGGGGGKEGRARQQLARQAALERAIDAVPARLDALRRNLKVAEMSAAGRQPAVSGQGVASMQAMLSALNEHRAGQGSSVHGSEAQHADG